MKNVDEDNKIFKKLEQLKMDNKEGNQKRIVIKKIIKTP